MITRVAALLLRHQPLAAGVQRNQFTTHKIQNHRTKRHRQIIETGRTFGIRRDFLQQEAQFVIRN